MEHAVQVRILKELMRQLDEGKNVDAGVQYRMPTTSYVCKEQALLEQKNFFQGHPQLIGLSGDLPEAGSYFTMDETGTPILATRDKNGEFHAFLNACRHRSVKVATEDRGNKSIFVCPFHHWSYANTGNLLAIPNEDHFGQIDKSCHGLLELPAEERDGLLWVHPQVDGELNVDDLLGDLAPEIASFGVQKQKFIGEKTIDMNLNWKLANDTFGETYHFGKLHKDTLGQLYYGNNLHFEEFGRHHRFVTASRGIDALREMPETEWQINHGTFVMYHLFPNVQFLTGPDTSTLIRIYPHKDGPGRSVTKISFYYSQGAIDFAAAQAAEQEFDASKVYETSGNNRSASLEASLEVFHSTVEQEDYYMGEMQQRAAENGQLKEVIFGRNEPALHHFHNNFREALGQPLLQPMETA